MKKFKSFLFACGLFFVSDCKDDQENIITFESIENEFGFKKPFSSFSKKAILEKFGNIEEYRSYLIKQLNDIRQKNKNSSISKFGIFKILFYNFQNDYAAYINCASDTYILDAAEFAGVDLPNSCRAGACSTCVGYVVSGLYTCDEQSFLDDCSLEHNYAPLCVTSPRSDMHILTHQEEEASAHDCSPPDSEGQAKYIKWQNEK